MRNLENMAGVQELSTQEMKDVYGGSWLSKAWAWIKRTVRFSVIPSGHTW